MDGKEAFRRTHLLSGGCIVEAQETDPTEARQDIDRTPGVRTNAPWNMTPCANFGASTSSGAAISASTPPSHPMHSSTVHYAVHYSSDAATQAAPASYGNDGRLDTQQPTGDKQPLPSTSVLSGSIYAADLNYNDAGTALLNQSLKTQQQRGYEQGPPSCSMYSGNIYAASLNYSDAGTAQLHHGLDSEQPTGDGLALPSCSTFSGNIFAVDPNISGAGTTLVNQRQHIQQPTGNGKVLPSCSIFSGNIFAADPNNSGAGTTLVNESFPGASGETSRDLRGSMDSSAALVCDICSFVFKWAQQLEKHTRDHEAGKRHQCSSCGSLWDTPSDLERHLLKHNNEKPFKCSVCQVSYKQKAHLTSHMKKKGH